MSDENKEQDNSPHLTLKIPVITTESETQTSGQLVSKLEGVESLTMEGTDQRQNMSIRKRRNLSKNRGQAARQREKTPEPGRSLIPHEDTTTSDDEDFPPVRNSREIEADNTYEEMKRLVQEKANTKDPVYDLNTDEVMEARAMAANERRRRSISPFAIVDKLSEETCKLERKRSFVDPTNKLLSTNYTLSPKDEDTGRRNSLTIETPRESRSSLSPPTPSSPTLNESNTYSLPSTPKKLEKIIYPDEVDEINPEEKASKPKTSVQKSDVFVFEEKYVKRTAKPTTPKSPDKPDELVTKVIQIERSPSVKILQEKKPASEVRERIVRTPSRKSAADVKPIVVRQQQAKLKDEPPQSKMPPVKPARSKSATRLGNKTSESEMSGDQRVVHEAISRRKVVPTPRRFIKNRSPRANRSQSVTRVEEVKVVDRTGTGMSQVSREIIELMQKARARSLSIPKDDPRLPPEYKHYTKKLQTPKQTPSTPRNARGISCPKTIQIISDKEILSGLTTTQRIDLEHEKRSRQSSGYIDASQSEYTSSCYSSSPSENEYEFDLSERTAELTRKLNKLSQEVDNREILSNIILGHHHIGRSKEVEQKSVLRKRSASDANKTVSKKNIKEPAEDRKPKIETPGKKKTVISKWQFIRNWQQFKHDNKVHYDNIILLRNRCICDSLWIIFMCGLGGIMFRSLEGSFENAYKCGTRNVKRDFIESLWRGSHYLREEDWKSMARKKLYEFENQLHTAFEAGVTSYSGQPSWNFMNSFVYCMTLITTIGYGHIAPKTTYGRAATIGYAIIGIPLFLIVLADFGKLFTRVIKFFWSFIRRFYYTRSCRKVRGTAPVQEVMKGLNIVYDVVRRPSQIFSEEDMTTHPDGEHPPPIERKPSDVPPPLPPRPGRELDLETPSVYEIDDEFNLPISVAIFILVVYIIIGAAGWRIYMWESWTFFESFYFVFISMSTIGLGDLVPDHPKFMMASILYLVFGLALTSMFINVVQAKLSNTFKQASVKLGATIGLRVSEDDGALVPITPPPIDFVPVHKPKVEIEEQTCMEEKGQNIENETRKES